ncbi:type II secretion system protein [Vibrio panuliri]|uniref:MSHA biogenesis protein MshA n=1 Tax=Vibrio panuliri TaxID=1381081 RepID=A0ABX3FML4_9VIBR|nr:type II secretion system protein [Vibrio panuliri]KAB1455415.1 type II secretion system protein [Vibrio panuliri]OLQ95451.1 MSHA biogenesis protein MshA [Vibrio panuliri]
MKRQGGFTLIELVVVIVILGILAVTAAPRFLNLQDDARNASLEGLKGAMAGATGIVYGRAAVSGVEKSNPGAVSGGTNGQDITTILGYPKASEDGIGRAVVGLSGSDSDWKVVSSGTNTISYSFESSKEDAKCLVKYTMNTTDGSEPVITVQKCDN